MAKYLLLKHYRGGPERTDYGSIPMQDWTPEEISAHIAFMDHVADTLRERGEFVDGQALSPDGTFVRFDGEGRPPVTDGPFAETKDLIAGWMVIDVDSVERAHEAAAFLSSAPGRGGRADPGVDRGAPVPRGAPERRRVNDLPQDLLRDLGPQVLGVLVRRGADFAAAEDAVQEALLEAVRRWPDAPPDDPIGWLVTVAWRKYLDAAPLRVGPPRPRGAGASTSRRRGRPSSADDTLLLLFLCCHPALTAASAVALTLRAVGGLTTRQIAEAYLVPEPTMAQRISRAKRTVGEQRLDRPGDLRDVLKVLYLIFNEGYSGEVDLAAEAIRLTRQLRGVVDEPEVAGLLALMLLHHARRAARWADDGCAGPADRAGPVAAGTPRWSPRASTILQAALAQDRLGEYQAQAAIAALHCDAASPTRPTGPRSSSGTTSCCALTDSPVVALNRAVAVGEADGPLAGLRALDVGARRRCRGAPPRPPGCTSGPATSPPPARSTPRRPRRATSEAERHHLTRQAARLRRRLGGRSRGSNALGNAAR